MARNLMGIKFGGLALKGCESHLADENVADLEICRYYSAQECSSVATRPRPHTPWALIHCNSYFRRSNSNDFEYVGL